MPYSTKYILEDYLMDEDFIQWVKAPNEENKAIMSSWISKHPGHASTVAEARTILLLLEFKTLEAPKGKFLEVWEGISKATDEEAQHLKISNSTSAIKSTSARTSILFFRAAAAVVLISLCFWMYTNWKEASTISVATAYGESRTLFLPDSTKVTLNSNSTLHYKTSDFNSNHRHVWLNGQAFFAVTHKSNNENFKVFTDELQVEVLGTRFDVNSRRGTTKVVLEEGKVKLNISGQEKKNQTVFMKPGDFVEVAQNSLAVNKKAVDTKDFLSWRKNRIEFSSMPLGEVSTWIEDNYGYEIVFADQAIKDKKFTGSSSTDDIKELLAKLSKVFNLDIVQDGDRITIKEL